MNTIINPETFTRETVNIAPESTQDEWASIHRSILLCKHASAKWLKQSRAFATSKWGEEFTADAEVQMEFTLGIETADKPASLNPPDKSKAIVTIEGIHQSFVLWERKMHDEVETWDKDNLKRALDLLEPMERQAKRVRELLGGEV